MTYDEFLKALPTDGWGIHVRSYFAQTRTHRLLRRHEWECPITSLESKQAVEWEAVSRRCRLPLDLAGEIVAAADEAPSYSTKIRRDLLLACGLKPEEAIKKEDQLC